MTKVKNVKNKAVEVSTKNILILQSKGGVGKSYLTQMLALYAQSRKRPTNFIDADNSSASLTEYFLKIENRKDKTLKFKTANLLSSDNRIDRTKLDYLMEDLRVAKSCVVDFGAASSDQFMHWLKENDYIDAIKELDTIFFLVMAGGNSIKECVHFHSQMLEIPSLKASGMVYVVANEFYGNVEGKSVAEYARAKIQIPVITQDQSSSTFSEWKKMLSNGALIQDLDNLVTFKKKAFHDYLEKIFVQFDTVFYD